MRIGRSARMMSAWALPVVSALVVVFAATLLAQSRRDVSVAAHRYAYTVDGGDEAVIRVRLNDVVRVTFSADDIPHSFTIDEYRISRRAEPGKPVTFEFHAAQAGEFLVYCNLAIDERCRRELHGRLIVEER